VQFSIRSTNSNGLRHPHLQIRITIISLLCFHDYTLVILHTYYTFHWPFFNSLFPQCRPGYFTECLLLVRNIHIVSIVLFFLTYSLSLFTCFPQNSAISSFYALVALLHNISHNILTFPLYIGIRVLSSLILNSFNSSITLSEITPA
jgi:hypothetical protein